MKVWEIQGLENYDCRTWSRGIPRIPIPFAVPAIPGFRIGFVEPNPPVNAPIYRTG